MEPVRSKIPLPRPFVEWNTVTFLKCAGFRLSICGFYALLANMSDGEEAHTRLPPPEPEVIANLPSDGGEEFNRLVFEASPYLLQHARNPVDWWPWGEEAFAEAKRLDKPVFLSVGYSTCHWCHVMEHESFEDEEVAEVLARGPDAASASPGAAASLGLAPDIGAESSSQRLSDVAADCV